MCIPWRNYQSLTDFLIDKSDFENTSRQISKVMYCLTVYVPCQCYCFDSTAIILLIWFDIIWNLTTIYFGTHYSNFSHDRFQCLTAFQIWSILDGSFNNQAHLFLVCTLFNVFSSFMCIKQRFKWVNVFRLNHKF